MKMICNKCKGKMNWYIENSIQIWKCPSCGCDIVTTYISDIDSDETEYSLYKKTVTEIDIEKIKLVAKIANVNSIIAKQMIEKNEVCILKEKATEIKKAIGKLQELGIEYKVNPIFNY